MNRICWVFLGGPIVGTPPMNEVPHSVVCADSGARHATSLSLTPTLVVGDFDSLSAREVEALVSSGVALERHPAEKDHSDFELVLSRIPAQGISTVRFFGIGGGRQDYHLNNLQVASAWRTSRGISVEHCTVHGDSDVGYLLHPGRNTLRVGTGARVSLVALSEQVFEVETDGLYWPLRNATIQSHSSHTLSNRSTEETVVVTYRSGRLLVVVAAPEE